MAENFKNKIKSVGRTPGSLIIPEGEKPEKSTITLVRYNRSEVETIDNQHIDDIVKQCQKDKVSWIQVKGIKDIEVLEALGEAFNIHPLFLEDIISGQQRPKFEMYDQNIYIISYLLRFFDRPLSLHDEQVAIVLTDDHTLITFVESDSSLFEPILHRINNPRSRLRAGGPDYLAYCILDLVIDYVFVTLDHVDQYLTHFEQDLINESRRSTIPKIQKSKRVMSQLRNSIWPMREVVSQFQRTNSDLITPNTKFYLHDVQDHLSQAMDIVENFREITSSFFEFHLAFLNQKMNDVMKTLTIVATIFVPLTFITSLYGMNFKNMPELEWYWGYPATLGFLAAVGTAMLFYFRRKNWI